MGISSSLPYINEIHYIGDMNQRRIEVAVEAVDKNAYRIEVYAINSIDPDGVYSSPSQTTTVGTIKYLQFLTPALPDESGKIVLFAGSNFITEILSYGNYPATFSTPIGVFESVNDASNFSLQRSSGCVQWVGPLASTFGAANVGATCAPTKTPTTAPTKSPTTAPTNAPTAAPTKSPTTAPTKTPTAAPTKSPTTAPTNAPTAAPTKSPTTKAPTKTPTTAPIKSPTTKAPTKTPTKAPKSPTTKAPTRKPTKAPSKAPALPTKAPVEPPVRCGLHGLNIFCPLPGKCSLLKRILNLGKCE